MAIRSKPEGAVFAVNALEEEFTEVADFCRHNKVGLEVTAFAYPTNLDDDYVARLQRHVAALDDIVPVICHGPYVDLYATSADSKVVSVARERHDQGLDAAVAMGARIYVAHLNSIPLIRNRNYRRRFVSAAAEFWTRLADRAGASGITIVLENMWESGPELQKAVVTHADHPNLKASFDNGHALVFSREPASKWIRTLGEDLLHLHLHDNDGTYDEHRPVGEGVENWAALIDAWRTDAPRAALVVESDRLVANQKALEALQRLVDTASDAGEIA